MDSAIANHVGNLGIGAAARAYKDEEMSRILGAITPKGHCPVASANVYTLRQDIGFESRTMARHEIEAGASTTSGTRDLMLPFVVSQSDLGIERFRQFMMGGGVLITDYHRPA